MTPGARFRNRGATRRHLPAGVGMASALSERRKELTDGDTRYIVNLTQLAIYRVKPEGGP
jgi:hypothetical protein